MMKLVLFVFLSGFIVLQSTNTKLNLSEDMTVSELESSLGFDYKKKKPNFNLKRVSAETGKDIVTMGFSKEGKSSQQSKHFVCTSCHNIVKEDPDLANADPDARLDYVTTRNLPFLQGTTLYGVVNRATYYNGDYDKKYGDLVKAARNDIRGAIQLCATECAQGRKLKDWELESVLAYLWTIELKVGDLQFSEDEKQSLEMGKEKAENLDLVKSKYLSGSPATFILPPADRKEGTGLVGNSSNGEKVYESSCLHCHFNGKYSYLSLDKTSISKNFLKRAIPKFSHNSIYQVTRWGVPTYAGKTSYMPQYPKEKMSNQQLADLRAYLEQ